MVETASCFHTDTPTETASCFRTDRGGRKQLLSTRGKSDTPPQGGGGGEVPAPVLPQEGDVRPRAWATQQRKEHGSD